MKSRGFEGGDVDGVYTDYKIFSKSRGCGSVDVDGVNDVYTNNINR